MKLISRNIAVLLMAASGCVPATVTEVPRISGRIVDPSSKPVGGAQISVAPDWPADAHLAFQLSSENDGRFHRDEKTRWVMCPLIPADAIAPPFTARFSYRDWQVETKHFGGGLAQVRFFGVIGEFPSADLGDIVIESPRPTSPAR